MTAVLPAPVPGRRGRPPCCSPELAIRVVQLRRQGLSYGAISALLNAEGVPTPTGRTLWYKAYVDRLLHTQYVRDIMESEAWDQSPGLV